MTKYHEYNKDCLCGWCRSEFKQRSHDACALVLVIGALLGLVLWKMGVL